MRISLFNNLKYKGKWGGRLAPILRFAHNVDFEGEHNTVMTFCGLGIFIYSGKGVDNE